MLAARVPQGLLGYPQTYISDGVDEKR
jgi:hypothetical protein